MRKSWIEHGKKQKYLSVGCVNTWSAFLGNVSLMLIPNAENAVVDIRKLRDYCLNLDHDEGKHKARLFSSILGMTAENAEQLCQVLLEVVKTQEAQLGRRDEFGQRYTLDFTLGWQDRSATIRSGWIIEHGSDIPRLTTCYPL